MRDRVLSFAWEGALTNRWHLGSSLLHFSLRHHLCVPTLVVVALLGPGYPWKQLKAGRLLWAHSFRGLSPCSVGLVCLGNTRVRWKLLFSSGGGPKIMYLKNPSARPYLLRFLSHTGSLSHHEEEQVSVPEDGSTQPLSHLHPLVSVITRSLEHARKILAPVWLLTHRMLLMQSGRANCCGLDVK